jgi:hypothetical protein
VTGLAAGAEDVALVLDFLNTVNVEEHSDTLDNETTWRAWLAERGLDPGAGPPQAREVRGALRAAVGDPDSPSTDAWVALRIGLHGGRPRLVADDAVGAVLAAATRLAVLGEWERVKICPADECRLAFFDRSRNRSRTWCSMQVCGNREKARAWRERTRTAP